MTDREKMVALLDAGCEYASNICGGTTCDDCDGGYHHGCTLVFVADHLLANGVVVREKGEWEPKLEYDFDASEDVVCGFHCSLCGAYFPYVDNFCPNCGADMRKEKPEA